MLNEVKIKTQTTILMNPVENAGNLNDWSSSVGTAILKQADVEVRR